MPRKISYHDQLMIEIAQRLSELSLLEVRTKVKKYQFDHPKKVSQADIDRFTSEVAKTVGWTDGTSEIS